MSMKWRLTLTVPGTFMKPLSAYGRIGRLATRISQPSKADSKLGSIMIACCCFVTFLWSSSMKNALFLRRVFVYMLLGHTLSLYPILSRSICM